MNEGSLPPLSRLRPDALAPPPTAREAVPDNQAPPQTARDKVLDNQDLRSLITTQLIPQLMSSSIDDICVKLTQWCGWRGCGPVEWRAATNALYNILKEWITDADKKWELHYKAKLASTTSFSVPLHIAILNPDVKLGMPKEALDYAFNFEEVEDEDSGRKKLFLSDLAEDSDQKKDHKAYFLMWCKTLHNAGDRFAKYYERILTTYEDAAWRDRDEKKAIQPAIDQMIETLTYVWGVGQFATGNHRHRFADGEEIVDLLGGSLKVCTRLADMLDRWLPRLPAPHRKHAIMTFHLSFFLMFSVEGWTVSGDKKEDEERLARKKWAVAWLYSLPTRTVLGGSVRDEGVATALWYLLNFAMDGDSEKVEAMLEAGVVVPAWKPWIGEQERIVAPADDVGRLPAGIGRFNISGAKAEARAEGHGDVVDLIDGAARDNSNKIRRIRQDILTSREAYESAPTNDMMRQWVRLAVRTEARARVGLTRTDPSSPM